MAANALSENTTASYPSHLELDSNMNTTSKVIPTPDPRRTGRAALAITLATAVFTIMSGCDLAEPPYTSRALLRVARTKPALLADEQHRETTEDYRTYCQTQARLLRSSFVLMAALRDPDTANLRVIHTQPDPVRWLQERIKVEFPEDSEIMEVSLSGHEPNEISALLRAVVQAYRDEVVDLERCKLRTRLAELHIAYADRETQIREKRKTLRELAERLNPAPPGSPRFKAAELEYLDSCREMVRLRQELTQARAELKVQQQRSSSDQERRDRNADDQADAERTSNDSAPDTKPLTPSVQEPQSEEFRHARDRVAVLEEVLRNVENNVEQQAEKLDRLRTTSIDIEMMREEIDQIEEVLTELGTERERLRIEVNADPRVTLIQQAEAPTSRN